MSNNLTLKVMANIAARQGYKPTAAPADSGQASGCPVHLFKNEEEILIRIIGKPGVNAAKTVVSPSTAVGMVSLDELAGQKR